VTAALPKPIYRYRGLFPVQFVEKLWSFRPTTPLFAKELALAEAALIAAETADDPAAAFWDRAKEIIEIDLSAAAPPGTVHAPFEGIVDDAPEILRPLLERWAYDVELSLCALRAPRPT
jgi:hypothetical protein